MKRLMLTLSALCLLAGTAHADLDDELMARDAAHEKAQEAATWRKINSENRQIALALLGGSVVKTENTHTYCFPGDSGSVKNGWDFRSILAKLRDGRICLIDNCSGSPKLIYCK